MDREKRQRAISRGNARWHPARLEGVQKNVGIKKDKKEKGMHKETRRRKVMKKPSRDSKRKLSRKDIVFKN